MKWSERKREGRERRKGGRKEERERRRRRKGRKRKEWRERGEQKERREGRWRKEEERRRGGRGGVGHRGQLGNRGGARKFRGAASGGTSARGGAFPGRTAFHGDDHAYPSARRSRRAVADGSPHGAERPGRSERRRERRGRHRHAPYQEVVARSARIDAEQERLHQRVGELGKVVALRDQRRAIRQLDAVDPGGVVGDDPDAHSQSDIGFNDIRVDRRKDYFRFHPNCCKGTIQMRATGEAKGVGNDG